LTLAIVEQESQMGGVEMSTLALARTLDRQRYRPVVIAPETGPLVTQCQASNVPVLLSPRPGFRSASFRLAGCTLADPIAIVGNPRRLWQAAGPLAQQLIACQADLVLTKGLLAHFYGGWAARRLGIPCIWHVQDEIPPRRAGGLYLRGLQATAQQLAVAVVGDAQSIATQFPRHPHVCVVYNGIDPDEFAPTVPVGALRDGLGIPREAQLVGNLARLTAWKGQHVLVEAFNRLALEFPDLHLALVGSVLFDDGSYEQRLRRLAAEGPAPRRVHFAGYRSDTARVLADLDLYVHPSLCKDTAPLALLSALATGLPTVVSAVPGILEVVEPGKSTLVFPPGDAAALATHLRALLTGPEASAQLGRAGRALALSRFSTRAYTAAMTAVFDQVLTSRDVVPWRK